MEDQILFRCHCGCNAILYAENNKLMFKSMVVSKPEQITNVDRFMLNESWSLPIYGIRKAERALKKLEAGE